MSQNKRLLIAGIILLLLIGGVMGVEALRRQQVANNDVNQMPEGMPTAAPGSIPITVNGERVASFTPEAIGTLPKASFADAEEGKTQEGWLLADVLTFYLADPLPDEALIQVRSNHRDKEITLTWAEVADPANYVMFDLSGRGTLKLVSLLPRLDTREEWVQDTDEITITIPKPMKTRYFSTFQLVLLALFAALIVVAKISLRLPLQLSGHSGLFWMAIMIVGAGIVNKRGAASLIGLTSGILAAFLGMGDFGAINTFLSYTAVGIGTDLAMFLLPNLEDPISATIVAAIGHTAKFLVKWLFGILTGAPVGFLALGLLWAMISYIFFGGLGGLLGSLTLKALRKAGFFVYMAEKR